MDATLSNSGSKCRPFAICLAVIFTFIIALCQVIEAQHYDTGNYLAPAQANPFKDLSSPTSGKVQTLDVICGKNFMTVRAEFSGPFYGIVFSKGTYGQENCIYVKPNSGLTHAAFNVYYDQCGTKPDLQGKFYENTIVIQYGSDIIEAYDEAKRLRCEWFEAYEKPATFKPAIPVADLEVVEMHFQGDDIDCWMEIQEGNGPWSREVSKIVPIGQPMTIVVAINDYNGQFDMRVKSCKAHDGVQAPISLTDEFGCVLRPKMITPFSKIRNPGGHKKATVLSYARFLAFKFPDSMTVQIQCSVEVCRHGCADACERVPSLSATTLQPELSLVARWPNAPNRANHTLPALDQGASRILPAKIIPAAEMMSGPDNEAIRFGAQNSLQYAQRIPEMNKPVGQLYSHRPQIDLNMMSEDMNSSDSEQRINAVMGANRLVPQHHSYQQQQPSFSRQQPPVPYGPRYPGLQRTPVTLPSPPMSSFTSTPITTTTTTTSTTSLPTTTTSTEPPTTTTTAHQSSPVDSSMLANVDERDNASVEGDKGEQVAKEASQQQTGASSTSADSQGDNKAEASAVKPSVVSPSQDQEPASQLGRDESNTEVSVKPSVQDDQEQVEPAKQTDDAAKSADSPASSTSSSLKTVEVEIPSNEDPVRGLIKNSDTPGVFNSVRLSNVNLNDNPYNFQDNQQSGDQQRQQPKPVYRQPQQQQQQNDANDFSGLERRDKGDEESNIEAIMSNSKSRFGARSQPQSSVHTSGASGAASESSPSNHQMSNVDANPSAASDTDRLLIDRSDDSPLVDSAVPSVQATDKVRDNMESSESNVDESSATGDQSNQSKVKPVVGTEELGSGPLLLEDRIGSQPDTLEEALLRLQQQMPQTAALVSSPEAQTTLVNSKSSPQQQLSNQNEAPSGEIMKTSESRLDVGQQQQQLKPAESISMANRAVVSNQPFPNNHGQAKVIPEPSTNIQRNPQQLLQASSDVVTNKQPVVSIDNPPQNSMRPNELPVAQITNVPLSIGFPQDQAQVPTVQQLNQQMAFVQQQQQQLQQLQQFQMQQQLSQQQQQQQQQPQKPTRSRFSLVSPQAAFQAIASRFKSKPSSKQQPQQANPQPSATRNQHYQLPVANLPAYQLNYNQPQSQPHGGLFARFNSAPLQQSQQPLIRSRRSAITPNGRRGSGELGMAKSFMVATGLDFAFALNSTDLSQMPQILEGRRPKGAEDDVIYGICMPVISFTFILTCLIWLVVFVLALCVYLLTRSRGGARSDEELIAKKIAG